MLIKGLTMATREKAIIAAARITLNDEGAVSPRWSDKHLMKLLSDGQDDMCKHIPLISRRAVINTASGQAEYRLPNDCVSLIYASSEGRALELVAYDEIERSNPDWEDDVGGSILTILVNALSQQTIRPYPKVAESKPIKVRYSALPIDLGWDETTEDSVEELTISDMWDIGLKQYVIGMAFLDYGDESSVSRAQVALGLYNADKTKAEKLSRKSFAKKTTTTGYSASVGRSTRTTRGDCNGRRR